MPLVPAGKYQLLRNVRREDSSYTSQPLASVEVRPSETSTVNLGGYVVSVRLRWPADLAPDENTRVGVVIGTPGPEPPAAIIQDPQALAQWVQSPEVRAMAGNARHYEFVERADGVWTAEGVPAGAAYRLEAWARDKAATNGVPPIAYGRMSVTVPAQPVTGTLDAGELVLQKVTSNPVRVTIGPP
jgi:hypothetical protein